MTSASLRKAMAVALAVSLGSSNAPMVAQTHSLREGTCEGAQQRFPDNNPGPGSLRAHRPLEIPDLGVYVRDRQAAIVLGKALFWDMQVGSDGIQACATCHFRAGADPRSINQANPGGLHNTDTTIHVGVNHALSAADFPLRKLADPARRTSRVLRDNDDVISSQGVKLSRITGVAPGAGSDDGVPVSDPVFNLARHEHPALRTAQHAHGDQRRLQPRPILGRPRRARLQRRQPVRRARSRSATCCAPPGSIASRRCEYASTTPSLASQAVGPPLSDREMGFLGRTFYDVGKRLVSAKPLARQKVHPDDSVLGPHVDAADDGRGGGRASSAPTASGWRRPSSRSGGSRTWSSTRHADGRVTFAPPAGACAGRQRVHAARVQLLALLRPGGAALRDDAGVGRLAGGPPLRRRTQRAVAAAAARPGRLHRRRRLLRPATAGAETTNNSNRILKGAVVDGVQQPSRDRRTHVQRQLRGRGLRPELLQHRRAARGRGPGHGQTSIRSVTRCLHRAC